MSDRRTATSVFVFVGIAVGFLSLLPNQMLADEYFHWPQARLFSHGQWAIDPWLATWPTLHFVMSCVLRVFQADALWVGRLMIVGSATLAYVGFMRLTDALHQPSPKYVRAREIIALQWFASPLLLLFCTVVYTDVPALAALIWAAVGVAERRRWLLVVVGIVTIALRQTHVLWFAWFVAWHLALVWREQMASEKGSLTARLMSLARIERATLIASAGTALAWLAVVALTNGIAPGVNSQPAHHISIGGVPNLFFAMVVWACAFAPIAAATFAKFVTSNASTTAAARGLRRRRILASIAIVVVVVALASFYFVATLPSNTHPSAMVFVRNQALRSLSNPSGRMLMIALCAAGALAWWRTEFAPSVAPFKWPFFLASALYLLPFSLIEQRYYLPMFTLLAAFRMPQKIRWEWAQLLWSLALSSVLLYHIVYKGRFL